MMKRSGVYLLAVLLIILCNTNQSAAQSADSWNEKNSSQWLKSLIISNGSKKLVPHSSIDKTEFAKQYHTNQVCWDKAFAFLKRTDLDTIAPGRYLIDGENVFAVITEIPSKRFDTSKWESHRNFADIHYVIRGKEKIGVAPVTAVTVTQEYNPARDLINYKGNGKYFIASPEDYFVFFPHQAHRPNIKVDGYEVVKKMYIKIRVASTSP